MRGMREIGRRLQALEERPIPETAYSAEQWSRLSDDDLEAMTTLPVKADGAWDVDRWTDEHRAFADAIYIKAMGEAA